MAATWELRRDELTRYFDRTAAAAWEALTSDAPVSRIRATVRAGRDAMRGELLARLPGDLHGARVLDAGCGTGALAVEAAGRGAAVVAVDVSPRLVETARERHSPPLSPRTCSGASGSANASSVAYEDRLAPEQVRGDGSIDWRVGDMLAASLGRFDHVVAMDSLIHYGASDIVSALAGLAQRTRRSIVFTVAPKTPLLIAMHAAGRLFPRADRAPAIVPVATATLRRMIARDARFADWRLAEHARIDVGFYKSQALSLVRR